MLDRIKMSWKLLRSKSYMIALEHEASCRINVREPFSFDTIVMLAAQYSSVKDFRDKMSELLEEHTLAAQNAFGIDPKSFVKSARKVVKAKGDNNNA